MKNARDTMFAKLKKFQNTTPLEIKTFDSNYDDIIEEFIKNATLAGAQIYKTAKEIDQFNDKKLDDSFICNSSLGVAENGALWCNGFLGKNRAKLFTCNDLIITIKKESIVSNMHDAYEKVNLTNRDFATFIAGPSKTADIEQSLVIGAHGAMSLHILLLD